jgi:hypothetical protein
VGWALHLQSEVAAGPVHSEFLYLYIHAGIVSCSKRALGLASAFRCCSRAWAWWISIDFHVSIVSCSYRALGLAFAVRVDVT